MVVNIIDAAPVRIHKSPCRPNLKPPADQRPEILLIPPVQKSNPRNFAFLVGANMMPAQHSSGTEAEQSVTGKFHPAVNLKTSAKKIDGKTNVLGDGWN
jgi:hypothetical protein